jgi:hypothetical protein
MFKRCLFVLLVALSLPITDAFGITYTVRTIYFIPADKVAKQNNFKQLMKDTQQVYREEMIKHGFGDKTFKLETDATVDVIIHQLKGKHNAEHYRTNTLNNTWAELPNEFRVLNNISVIFFAGMNIFESSVAFAGAFMGGEKGNGDYGGIACIAADLNDRPMSGVIEHELGHTFGLWHNFVHDGESYLMGPGDDVLHKHEARWLSKNHYFNDHYIFNLAPIVDVRPLEVTGRERVTISLFIEDPDGLHQIELVLSKKLRSEVFHWRYLDGNRLEIEITVDRDVLAQDNFFRIYPMDDFGNYRMYEHHYVLPDPEPAPVVWRKNHDLNIEEQEEEKETEVVEKPIEDTGPKLVKAKNRMLTSWAKLKRR